MYKFYLHSLNKTLGHKHDDGSLYQMMKTRAEDVPEILKWLELKRYQSPQIINEIITLMGQDVLRGILVKIREAGYFGLMADETRDISNKEQLAVCCRWVDEGYNVHEDPLGLLQISSCTADSIVSHLKDVLVRCILPLNQCRGQGYDGAAAMSGRFNGVSTQIQQEEPRAIPVHCLAHSLNLCLQDVCKSFRLIKNALELVREAVYIVNKSPKRAEIFNEKQTEDEETIVSGHRNLKPLCPTRWTVRTDAIKAVLDNYEALKETCKDVADEGGDVGLKADGMLKRLKQFSTLFGLRLSYLVFSAGEELSRTLQSKDCNIQEAINSSNLTGNYYKRMRSDEEFNGFYDRVVKESEDKTKPPSLARQRKAPARLDDGVPGHCFSSPKAFHRQQYFEVLDLVCQELLRRFDQKSFSLLRDIEQLLLKAANGNNFVIKETISDIYAGDLDLERLELQLKMLPDLVKCSNAAVPIKQVTKLETLCNVMVENPNNRNLFSEIDKLLRLYLTVPATSATAERTFSVLRRLKSYLRATMKQERLNSVILLNIYQSEFDDLDIHRIAEKFAACNERRRAFFGSFD